MLLATFIRFWQLLLFFRTPGAIGQLGTIWIGTGTLRKSSACSWAVMGARTKTHSLANAPLRENCVLCSDAVDESHSFLRHKNLGLHPTRTKAHSEGFHATINAADMPNIYVAYMAYRAEMGMTALAPLDTDYGIQLPPRGRIETQNRTFQRRGPNDGLTPLGYRQG